jgi:hypothetical protein
MGLAKAWAARSGNCSSSRRDHQNENPAAWQTAAEAALVVGTIVYIDDRFAGALLRTVVVHRGIF